MPTGVYERRPRLVEHIPGIGPLAAELRRALVCRNWKLRELADAAQVSVTTVTEMAGGTTLPQHGTVVRIADALGWPQLIDASTRLRLGACEVCRRAMVNTSQRTRRYCSRTCAAAARNRRRTGVRRQVGTVARHRLADHQKAVAAMCRTCSPDGICRVADCPLRAVSPFPLVVKEARLTCR